MKILSIVLICITLNTYCQTNDTIYILFKNHKSQFKKLNVYDKTKSTPSFSYKFEILNLKDKASNFLLFNTSYDFYRDIPPIFKPKSFIRDTKKKDKLFSYNKFKKIGYKKTKSFLDIYCGDGNKIFIIDLFEKRNDSLYLREVKFSKFDEI